MTDAQAIVVAVIIGALSVLAVFCEPPRWMHVLMFRLAQWLEQTARDVFYRGRHFPTTTDGAPVLVTEIRARLLRESVVFLRIVPDTQPMRFDWRAALNPADFADAQPEQLGGLSS